MTRARLIWSMILSGLAGAGLAQDCSCDRIIPVEGSYKIHFNEKKSQAGRPAPVVLTVEESVADIVQNILMEGSGGRMFVSCTPEGYLGTMHPGAQPVFIPGNQSDAPGAETGELVEGETIPTGIRLSTEFKFSVVRPGGKSMKKLYERANEDVEPEMRAEFEGSARAPDEMCKIVAKEIRDNQDFIDAYSDYELVEEAVALKLPAISSKVRASPTGALLDALSYSPNRLRGSYRQRVFCKLDESLCAADEQETEGDTIFAGASTDASSCKIKPPSLRTPDGRCRLGVEIDAMMAHERMHRSDCIAVKESTDEEGFERWVNHPMNHAESEISAHREGQRVLREWLEKYCS